MSKSREQLFEEYKKIARTNIRKRGFTKEEALDRVYIVKGKSAGYGLFKGMLYLPVSLINCKVKLVEVKVKK